MNHGQQVPILPHHHEAQHHMALLPNYYGWILDRFQPWIGSRILDVGSGVGNITGRLPKWERLVLLDSSPVQCEEVRARFKDGGQVEIVCQDILDPSIFRLGRSTFDTILCLDVLEHLENDEKALQHCHGLLAPGGHLLLKVPAHPWLYGTMDRASGHFRRYAKSAIMHLALTTRFRVVSIAAMNPLAILPWWFKGRVLKREVNFSRTFSLEAMHRINRCIPLLSHFDRVWPFPLGLSLVVVLQR